MWVKAFSVGGLTVLSRLFGFIRDVAMAALMGAGPLADAFMIALRLPNHFRSIFAEGAFNAAFVPRYSAVLETGGGEAARRFAGAVLTLTVIVQVVLLAGALLGTPWLVRLLAPGFTDDPERLPLTIELTRITFPYLGLIACMALVSGMLNAHGRFVAAAATGIVLNVSMVGFLLAASLFETPAHALAWGVTVSGVLQLLLVLLDLRRAGTRLGFSFPRLTPDVRKFFRAFGPATLGSAGTQIAAFADTILASFLAAGAVSYLYYADRLYQLPLGVIGIAVGTVLLPDLARRIAAGDERGARAELSRAIEGCVVLTLPFCVLFVVAAAPTLGVLFGRGAFDAAAVTGAAQALTAYAIATVPAVALRPLIASFHARGDTATPVKVLAGAIIVNVGLKILLIGSLAHAGLALATACGVWINALLLGIILTRSGRLAFAPVVRLRLLGAVIGAIAMGAVLLGLEPVVRPLAGLIPRVPDLAPFAARCAAAGLAYLAVMLVGIRLAARWTSPAPR